MAGRAGDAVAAGADDDGMQTASAAELERELRFGEDRFGEHLAWQDVECVEDLADAEAHRDSARQPHGQRAERGELHGFIVAAGEGARPVAQRLERVAV